MHSMSFFYDDSLPFSVVELSSDLFVSTEVVVSKVFVRSASEYKQDEDLNEKTK